MAIEVSWYQKTSYLEERHFFENIIVEKLLVKLQQRKEKRKKNKEYTIDDP